MFACSPLVHDCVLDVVLLCLKHLGDPVRQMEEAAVMFDLLLLPV